MAQLDHPPLETPRPRPIAGLFGVGRAGVASERADGGRGARPLTAGVVFLALLTAGIALWAGVFALMKLALGF